MNGASLDSTRQPQAMPSGTLVLPVGAIASIDALMASWPAVALTSVSGVIGLVVQPCVGPVVAGRCGGPDGAGVKYFCQYFCASARSAGVASVRSFHQLLVRQ